jgi:hypothetical protein
VKSLGRQRGSYRVTTAPNAARLVQQNNKFEAEAHWFDNIRCVTERVVRLIETHFRPSRTSWESGTDGNTATLRAAWKQFARVRGFVVRLENEFDINGCGPWGGSPSGLRAPAEG